MDISKFDHFNWSHCQ